jgi:hypothetical protein
VDQINLGENGHFAAAAVHQNRRLPASDARGEPLRAGFGELVQSALVDLLIGGSLTV